MTDKELIKIVSGFTKGLTGGNIDKKCYWVSWPLQSYLYLIGVHAELIECEVETPTELWGHYCLKLKDGRILDATAGQFNGLNLPKIYLGEMPKTYKQLT